MAQGIQEQTKTTVISASTTAGQLNCKQQLQINQHYKRCLPAYAGIREEYEEDKERAKRIHKLKEFPTEEEWEPRTRKLSFYERSLLCGPPSNIVVLKQVEAYIATSNRWITYASTKEPPTSGRICSSIVQVHQHEAMHHSSPQFGCITQLFTHLFSGVTTVFAVVALFGAASIDIELGMWFVPMKLTADSLVVTTEEMSEPLVTAYDNEIIWLLNIQY